MHKTPYKIFSPAKLNLCLNINDKNQQGYHNLQTVFCLLDFGDQITIQPSNTLSVTTTNQKIEQKDNIAYKAIQAFNQHTKQTLSFDISIQKNIPTGAGLGGGSSNAGNILNYLHSHFNPNNVPISEIHKIAAQLGADVPVFLHNKHAWAEGIGDKLTPITLKKKTYLIVYPNCHACTQTMFTHKDLDRNNPSITYKDFLEGYRKNSFTTLAEKLYPNIFECLSLLNQYEKAQLSGSGSSCFIPINQNQEYKKLIQILKAKQWQYFIANTLPSL